MNMIYLVSTIQELQGIDLLGWLIVGFMIMSAIVAGAKIITEFSVIIKKPIGAAKRRKEDHELLMKTVKDLSELHSRHETDTKQSIRHDEMIREDIRRLTSTVNGIVITLEEMQRKNNETKLKELKDSLITYYNKYRVTGEWTKLEKEAFWDLFDEYEKRGGDGYIHSIVEPVMRELREID